MSEFASGVMMRLLLSGMAQAGMLIPEQAPPEARVPLARKRALVNAVLAQGGHAGLLRLGMGIERLAGDPIHQVLGSARDPHDFLVRWRALERYMHSRHRVELLHSAERALLLRHCAPGRAEAPAPAESLLVMGVIAAGLEAVGSPGTELEFAL